MEAIVPCLSCPSLAREQVWKVPLALQGLTHVTNLGCVRQQRWQDGAVPVCAQPGLSQARDDSLKALAVALLTL